jgi:hypothetical protein
VRGERQSPAKAGDAPGIEPTGRNLRSPVHESPACVSDAWVPQAAHGDEDAGRGNLCILAGGQLRHAQRARIWVIIRIGHQLDLLVARQTMA